MIEDTSPLGLHVRWDRGVPCCDGVVTICAGKGPHAYSLRCSTCDNFRGWLSKPAATFINEAARVYGASRDAVQPHKALEIIEMDTSSLVKLRYMKASRASGSVVATIAGLEMHAMRDGQEKPVLVFANGQPSLVLNQENLYALQDALGFESDDWVGARVEISPSTFTTQTGETKPMLTVRLVEKPPQAEPQPQPTPAAPTEVKRKPRRDDDEPIPF